MSIQGIGSPISVLYPSPASSGSGKSSPFGIDDDSAAQNFLNEIKKSPIERMVDAWLKAHGLTKEDLEKMPPEKQQAIMKQMSEDIAEAMKRKIAENQKGVMTNVVA